MIAFSLSDSEKYFSWASLHFFFATSHSLLRDSNSLLWVRLVEFCTKKKYNTIVSVNYVQKWYFSSFWQTQHDSCTYRDIGKLKTQDVFERGLTSTENEALCLLICLDATICALQSVFTSQTPFTRVRTNVSTEECFTCANKFTRNRANSVTDCNAIFRSKICPDSWRVNGVLLIERLIIWA